MNYKLLEKYSEIIDKFDAIYSKKKKALERETDTRMRLVRSGVLDGIIECKRIIHKMYDDEIYNIEEEEI